MKTNKKFLISLIILVLSIFYLNSYSSVIDDPNCKCENCKCIECKCESCNCSVCNCENCKCNEGICSGNSCKMKDGNECKCENCDCTKCIHQSSVINYNENCKCMVCECGNCKCEGIGNSSGINAHGLILRLVSNINNDYENLAGNIRERCCSKDEIYIPKVKNDTLLTCVVSKETITNKPIKLSYLGNEYVFCSNDCLEKFKSEPMNYIKEQLLCPVMGDEAEKELFTVYKGIKYYFCCKGCIKKFNENPEKYIDGYKGN